MTVVANLTGSEKLTLKKGYTVGNCHDCGSPLRKHAQTHANKHGKPLKQSLSALVSAHASLDFVESLSLTELTLKLATMDVQHSAATVTYNAATVKRRRPVHVDAP